MNGWHVHQIVTSDLGHGTACLINSDMDSSAGLRELVGRIESNRQGEGWRLTRTKFGLDHHRWTWEQVNALGFRFTSTVIASRIH